MIRITVQLIPHGDTTRTQTIACAEIWNNGTGTKTSGNYGYLLYGKKRCLRSGSVFGFPRKQRSVWHLIALCLRKAFP